MSRTIASFSILFLLVSCAIKKKDYNWMDRYKAIICLTYDDGMKTQYTNALPQLNEFGIKGTFFINNVSNRESLSAWRKASFDGHELGNHTLFHPCPKSFGWPKEVTTDNYSIDLILAEIETVNSILNITELKTKKRAFAYPCNNMFIGEISYKKHLENSKMVSFARSGSFDKTVLNRNYNSLDHMNVPSWIVTEGTTFLEIKDYIDKVSNQKGIGIIQFHGIGGEWLSISSEDHYKLIQYLNKNKETILVTTFSNVMEYLENK